MIEVAKALQEVRHALSPLEKDLAAWCRANKAPLSEVFRVYDAKRAPLPKMKVVKI